MSKRKLELKGTPIRDMGMHPRSADHPGRKFMSEREQLAREYYPAHRFSETAKHVRVDGAGQAGVEEFGQAPAVYDTYHPDMEDLERMGKIVEAGKLSGLADGTLQAPISESMVQAWKDREGADLAAEFDTYVHREIDYTNPGQANVLKQLAPEFVERKLAQLERDHQIMFRESVVNMFGPQDAESFRFKFHRDRGDILTSQEQRDDIHADDSQAFVDIPDVGVQPGLIWSFLRKPGESRFEKDSAWDTKAMKPDHGSILVPRPSQQHRLFSDAPYEGKNTRGNPLLRIFNKHLLLAKGVHNNVVAADLKADLAKFTATDPDNIINDFRANGVNMAAALSAWCRKTARLR